MEQLTTLYIDKERHKFSVAHFTIFSATERERLHGHNYSVSARIVAPMGDNGFAADYKVYKNRLGVLCEKLDEYMLLAGESPYQQIEEDGACYHVTFAGVQMQFLRSDTQRRGQVVGGGTAAGSLFKIGGRLVNLTQVPANRPGRPVTGPGRIDDRSANPDGRISVERDTALLVESPRGFDQPQRSGVPQLLAIHVTRVSHRDFGNDVADQI